MKSEVVVSNGHRTLHAAPINRDWIIEGRPEASGCPIFETSDRGANVHEWRCTGGRFVWHYGVDEIVYIVEGGARIKDLATGAITHISAGSSVLFQRGSSAEWTVDTYVRKIAINHIPLSPQGTCRAQGLALVQAFLRQNRSCHRERRPERIATGGRDDGLTTGIPYAESGH